MASIPWTWKKQNTQRTQLIIFEVFRKIYPGSQKHLGTHISETHFTRRTDELTKIYCRPFVVGTKPWRGDVERGEPVEAAPITPASFPVAAAVRRYNESSLKPQLTKLLLLLPSSLLFPFLLFRPILSLLFLLLHRQNSSSSFLFSAFLLFFIFLYFLPFLLFNRRTSSSSFLPLRFFLLFLFLLYPLFTPLRQ